MTTSTSTLPVIQSFLERTPPFDQLSGDQLHPWLGKFKLLRYRLGQSILLSDTLPAHIAILYEGHLGVG